MNPWFSATVEFTGTAVTGDCPECGCTALVVPFVLLSEWGVTPRGVETSCSCGYTKRDLP